MMLPPSLLEEIRNRLPVSEVVGKHVRLIRAGREFKGVCPFHHEKSPSFYVNDDKQFYHCFGCGAHGDVITFMMRQSGMSFPDAVENLASQAGLSLPQADPKQREIYDRQKSWGQLLERAARFFQQQLQTPQGKTGLDYFYRRGLTDDAIERFRLGFAPADAKALIAALKDEGFTEPTMLEIGLIKKSDNSNDYYSFFRNRIIFPVGDRRGNIVGFGARLLSGDGPKYINSPDHPLFHKGRLLYGISRARAAIQQNQPLIVVEGYMDVIAAVEAGYIGAVAPLGTALTEEQMLSLWKLLPKIEDRAVNHDYSPILCFDGDAAGQRAATRAIERALPLINPAQTLRIAFMPLGEDPDSLLQRSGKLALQSVLDQAKPLIDVVWESGLQGRRLQTPEDKAMFRAALQRQTRLIADHDLRQLYEHDIKDRLHNLFSYKKEQQYQAGFGRRKSKFPPPDLRPVTAAARRPPQPGDMQERIILATLANHPDLMSEFGEDLVQYPFIKPEHRVLAAHMVMIFAETGHEVLDAEQYFRHLLDAVGGTTETERLEACLSELRSEHTYMHAGFARPEQKSEAARDGLLEIWNRHYARQADQDIAAAHARFLADLSEENKQRLFAVIRGKQGMQAEDGGEYRLEKTGTHGE
mgnify:CR=1 FL=1